MTARKDIFIGRLVVAVIALYAVPLLFLVAGCASSPKGLPPNDDLKGAVADNRTIQEGVRKVDIPAIDVAAKRQLPKLYDAQDYIDELYTGNQKLEEAVKARDAEIKKLRDDFFSVRQRRWFWTIVIGYVVVGFAGAALSLATGNIGGIGGFIIKLLPAAQVFTGILGLFVRKKA